MKPKFQTLYMNIAQEVSTMSQARRLQVGAIVVKDDRIISIGYNGMPSGWDNNCEEVIQHSDDTTTLKTKPEVLHAETNAIAKLAKSSDSGSGAVMFVTHSPCLDCAKLVYQSGISCVVYRDSYRSDSGVDFLQKSGVEVVKLDA
jgi:dCMP deaminase